MFAKIRQSPLRILHPLAWSPLALAAVAIVVALAAGGPAAHAAPLAQAPSGVTATRSADGASATLNWTPATGAELQWVYAAQKLDPGEPDTYWGQLGIDTDTIKIHGRNLPGDTRTLEITGLHPGRAYQYGIATRTTNAAGQQTWSAWQRYNDIDQVSCYHSGAVPDAASNSGLLSDCRTLLGLRDALQGADASPRLDWSAASAMADWEGITVEGTPPRVVRLHMDNRNLTGILPPALSQLDALQNISLPDNALTGTIPPELGRLANLIFLRLEKNDLEGGIPPELGNLSRLQNLILSNNHIGGHDMGIPPELGRLSNLESLQLDDNELHGDIPPELGNLPNLETLILADNLLHGTIPPELGRLTSLLTLALYDNHIEGSIPPELGSLSSLRHMSMNNNRLRGAIPPELGNLPRLTALLLADNRLTGTIPPELGNLSTVFLLYLNDNRLTGEIPPELGQMSRLTALFIYDNDLTGSVPPELGQLPLLTVRLAGNDLTGCLPAAWQRSIRPDLNDFPAASLPFCEAETPPAQ